MAFCDNPKCRFKGCNGNSARYIKSETPMPVPKMADPVDLYRPLCKNEEIIVMSNFRADIWAGKKITRNFCDECMPLVIAAESELKYVVDFQPHFYAILLNDHGDNLLIHFVQSEWFARENGNKKSQF